MKLGFWNRLAIVGGTLLVFGVPTWWALTSNAKHSQVMSSGYDACIKPAVEASDNRALDYCWKLWIEPRGGYIGWAEWGQAVLWAIPAALILYTVLFLVVRVARWVLAGRAT